MNHTAWEYRVEGFRDAIHSDDSLEGKAKAIGEAIQCHRWFKLYKRAGDPTLQDTLEELTDAAEADDVDWFDNVLDALYDIADADKAWLS